MSAILVCTLLAAAGTALAGRSKGVAPASEARGLAFAPEHPALSQIERRYLESLFANYVGPQRASSQEWKAMGLDAKMKEAHGVVLKTVKKQFKTKALLDYAREIMNQARLVKMTSIGIAEPMTKGVELKSPTEKGVVPGKYPHPKNFHTKVMGEIFGVPERVIRRHFRDEHYPRYGYLHFDGLADKKFIHSYTSDGYDSYGELMWIYKNDPSTRALITTTSADSGNNGGIGLPFSRAFVDFQLADLAGFLPPKERPVAKTREQVVSFFRKLSAPQSMALGMPEGQAYSGSPGRLEAVAIRDHRLFSFSDAMPFGFVEGLRSHGIKFYVIKTDPTIHQLYHPRESSQRSRWIEVHSSRQMYQQFMDKRAASRGRHGQPYLDAGNERGAANATAGGQRGGSVPE